MNKPLAELMRPKSLSDYVGQEHLIGKGAVLQKSIERGNIPSMILWGPPGVGKTTLANIIANQLNCSFYTLSAISSGVKEVREIIEKASNEVISPILFIDEIHRFNKAQQDSLLGAVERGVITLIGATTENPSFEVIAPLLSRCQVYILKSLTENHLQKILAQAISIVELELNIKIELAEVEALYRISGGDARKLLNAFQITIESNCKNKKSVKITNKLVLDTIQQNLAIYDKSGEMHYDIISAFIKSMRGSDPNAAVYWLARMIKAGEDPKFIARRMVILASEDIGNANPNALLLANNCFQAINVIGMPEGRIILSQTAVYLATSPKSNSTYLAIDEALGFLDKTGDLPVPLHLRNAPTKFMKNIGYGKEYKYAHDFENNFTQLEFLPDKIVGKTFFKPGNNSREIELRNYLKKLWGNKYDY
ncbi:MAG: replication-associated recombination protein A [Bacteroidota bacterium]